MRRSQKIIINGKNQKSRALLITSFLLSLQEVYLVNIYNPHAINKKQISFNL